mmetsp:Transcript_27111/g.82155  ORF Transcript_27111/g.82155 Transcript_27111/m.82155 type:complete len:287 (-) Transcript_27111:146-1006(-)|eukprot:scaffold29385_cov36-Tisochrysis_lutea.AAC.1
MGERWVVLRSYHRLLILVLMAAVWGVVGLSTMYIFLFSSSDLTHASWQPVSLAGSGPKPLPSQSEDAHENGGSIGLQRDAETARSSGSVRLQRGGLALKDRDRLLEEGVGWAQLSVHRWKGLESRLQHPLQRVEHAAVALDGFDAAAQEAIATTSQLPVVMDARVESSDEHERVAGRGEVLQAPPNIMEVGDEAIMRSEEYGDGAMDNGSTLEALDAELIEDFVSETAAFNPSRLNEQLHTKQEPGKELEGHDEDNNGAENEEDEGESGWAWKKVSYARDGENQQG